MGALPSRRHGDDVCICRSSGSAIVACVVERDRLKGQVARDWAQETKGQVARDWAQETGRDCATQQLIVNPTVH